MERKHSMSVVWIAVLLMGLGPAGALARPAQATPLEGEPLPSEDEIRLVSDNEAWGVAYDEQADREQERRDREQEKRDREQERLDREQEKADREEEAYERGTEALDEGRWEQAIQAFDGLANEKSRKGDAALYWKAYAQNKAGQRPAALATLSTLQKAYPQSRWLKEAKALEQEIRQGSGQAPRPEQEADEDLKLMALNALLNTDQERAIPMLEKFLSGSASPKLKERALFVLAQSGSPRAREIMAKAARGESNPDLQRKAVEYLGIFGGAESRQILSDLYAGATDVDVKKRVLHAFMVAGDKPRILAAAKGEKTPELRREAIQQLGVMGAQAELWEMYRMETTAEAKRAILQALFVGGASDKISELAKTEKDPDLRRDAIHHLGLFGSERTGPLLVSLYGAETDVEVRRAILHSLFIQGNAKALVEIARSEKDPRLKKEAVGHLSHMDSKLATDFLIEILNK
jgi:HEAT repeat protein